MAPSIFLKILSLRCSPDLYPLLYLYIVEWSSVAAGCLSRNLYIAHWIGVAAGCLSRNLSASFYESAGNFRCSTCPTGIRLWLKLRLLTKTYWGVREDETLWIWIIFYWFFITWKAKNLKKYRIKQEKYNLDTRKK